MLSAGSYYTLKVVKTVPFGIYLDADGLDVLLPLRYVTPDMKQGTDVDIFLYHDNEGRLIATTDSPLCAVGEIAYLEVVNTSPHGAFLHWGIMKDVFIPFSQMRSKMQPGNKYFVALYVDELTGRVAATEKIDDLISNTNLTVKENEQVKLLVFGKTDLGYKVIVNNKHIGLLYYDDVFKELDLGQRVNGFIKTIRPNNKLDVMLGIQGYAKVEGEEQRILALLKNNNGFLPYNDKSNPDVIYTFFGYSKRNFKMIIGALYKKRLISIEPNGIKLTTHP
ncbi:MAG: hypothetical protein EBX41_03665 [Chitinophagia bacterium]|nr:hypothetical protein [Chitinophagia bacterium]